MNSKRRPFYFLATAALIVAAPRAKAELIQVTWDSNGRYEHQLTVAPAKFAEVCDRLKPGAQVQWTFEVIWQFTKAGKVDFACLQPGHYDAGMKGAVTVAAAKGSTKPTAAKSDGHADHKH